MLFAAASLALAATAPLPVLRTEGVAAVRPGQVATLTVYFPGADEVMINRGAPSKLLLKTPWGKAQAKPAGVPSQRKGFEEYFAQVRPVQLKVRVPKDARPGLYPVQVEANLFVCDVREKVCVRRDFGLRSGVQVLPPGLTAPTQAIRLTEEDLRPPKGRFGL